MNPWLRLLSPRALLRLRPPWKASGQTTTPRFKSSSPLYGAPSQHGKCPTATLITPVRPPCITPGKNPGSKAEDSLKSSYLKQHKSYQQPEQPIRQQQQQQQAEQPMRTADLNQTVNPNLRTEQPTGYSNAEVPSQNPNSVSDKGLWMSGNNAEILRYAKYTSNSNHMDEGRSGEEEVQDNENWNADNPRRMGPSSSRGGYAEYDEWIHLAMTAQQKPDMEVDDLLDAGLSDSEKKKKEQAKLEKQPSTEGEAPMDPAMESIYRDGGYGGVRPQTPNPRGQRSYATATSPTASSFAPGSSFPASPTSSMLQASGALRRLRLDTGRNLGVRGVSTKPTRLDRIMKKVTGKREVFYYVKASALNASLNNLIDHNENNKVKKLPCDPNLNDVVKVIIDPRAPLSTAPRPVAIMRVPDIEPVKTYQQGELIWNPVFEDVVGVEDKNDWWKYLLLAALALLALYLILPFFMCSENCNIVYPKKKEYTRPIILDMGKPMESPLPMRAEDIESWSVKMGRPQKDAMLKCSRTPIEEKWNTAREEGTHLRGRLRGHGVTRHEDIDVTAAMEETTKLRRFEPKPRGLKEKEGVCLEDKKKK